MSLVDNFTGLQDAIKARLQEITDGVEFDDPNDTGGKSALRFYSGGVPPKRHNVNDKENFPFVAIRIVSGGSSVRESNLIAHIIGGVYTHDDDVSIGQAESIRLLELLLGLEEKRAIFVPYKLAGETKWQLGDEEGKQPHPYYEVKLSVTFKGPPRMLNNL